MVFFLCSSCGESVKKGKVATHRCRGVQWSCMDCGKIFDGISYNKHTICISEAEKYEGKLYKGNKSKSSKETVAQIWKRSCVEAASKAATDNEIPRELRDAITSICSMENIPRKHKKFENFTKNLSVHLSTTTRAQLWDYISTIFSKNKSAVDIAAASARATNAQPQKKKSVSDILNYYIDVLFDAHFAAQ